MILVLDLLLYFIRAVIICLAIICAIMIIRIFIKNYKIKKRESDDDDDLE